jgi:hypothetical protein
MRWCQCLGEAALVGVVLLSACGGDGGAASPTATAALTPTAVTTSPTSPAEPTPTIAADDAGAIDQVTQAYVGFFDGSGTTVDEKVALLEDGETYRSMLEDAAADPQAQLLSAEVLEVEIDRDSVACDALGVTAPCAHVVYNLLVAGMPMAVKIEGAALEVDGTWLVASAAWCHVVEIGGESCP